MGTPPYRIWEVNNRSETGVFMEEKDHFKACVAYLKEPLLDGICAPILEDFFGRKIRSHSPTELGGSLMHAMNLRAAARLVASTTELLTNSEMMNKALHYQQYGCYSGNLAGAIYGGYAGGAEGTAVLQTAYHLMGTLLYSSHYEQNFPFHLKYGSNTGREMLWIVSTYSQAIARNTKMPQTSNGFANGIVNTLLEKYEKDIPEAPIGKTIQEMYDLERAVPGDEAREQYEETVKELKKMGVPFPY